VSPLIADRAFRGARPDRPRSGRLAPRRGQTELSPSAPDGAGGGPTLDELLSGVWERLTAHAVADCPVCGGQMAPEYGVHALPIGGRCADCASGIS
jgi:hypothetical protein